MTSGSAIAIGGNKVTIDCDDFKLGGLAAGIGTQTTGISALDRQNATVRHCNIRDFLAGIINGFSTAITACSDDGGNSVH